MRRGFASLLARGKPEAWLPTCPERSGHVASCLGQDLTNIPLTRDEGSDLVEVCLRTEVTSRGFSSVLLVAVARAGPGTKALRLPVTLQEGSAGPVAEPTGFVQSVNRPLE